MMGKIWILVVSLNLSFIYLSAQQKMEPVQVLTIADGLAHNGVTSICEDSRGYLWFGTYDGLNRYDGYEFKVFKNTPARKLFVSNRIRSIAEDGNGNLWLGTDEGISVYNYALENFEHLFSNSQPGKNRPGPLIRDVVVNKKAGKIVCATEREGILIFNQDYSFEQQVLPPGNFLNNPILLLEGAALDERNYLFVSNAGLLTFNSTTRVFKQFLKGQLAQHNSMLRLNEKEWLISCSDRLVLARIKKDKTTCDVEIVALQGGKRPFRKIALDAEGSIWASIHNYGLVCLDKTLLQQKREIHITSVFDSDMGMYRASGIHINATTGCWVSSFYKGIFRFTIRKNPFVSHTAIVPPGKGIRSNRVSHITSFDKDRVLLAIQNTGLKIFNSKYNAFEQLPASLERINSPLLTAVFVDSRKDVWFNLNNNSGFGRIRKNGVLEKIPDKLGIYGRQGGIRSIEEDKHGNIWLVGSRDVYKINLDKNGEVSGAESLEENPFFEGKAISIFRCLYGDSRHNFIWVGTNANGLLRVNLEKVDSLKHAKIDQYVHDPDNRFSVSSNFISCITRLENGQLWLGTERGGICKVVNSGHRHPEFVNFAEDQGLSNNVVKAIISDEHQNLWISTNIGLSKFNTRTEQFRIFKKDNGLPFEDFYYAAESMQNGYIVLSGISGFCFFDPFEVSASEELPKLDFNNFKIFNSPVGPGDSIGDRVILEKRLAETETIHLKHDENVFSVELTSLHYSTPENHFLRYRLDPVNEEWMIVPSDQRTINYNGLQPGEYELKAMASNTMNEWTAPEILKISIEPPFWKTLPAYMLYVFTFGLIAGLVMFYLLRMNRLRHKLELEHLEKENVKEVNAAKLRFFTNISHEIKTPLTLISGPVDIMTQRYKGNAELNDKLRIVQRQSKKIRQLIDKVQDFQRSDVDKLQMEHSRFCFNIFLMELARDFYFLAETEKKHFELKMPEEKVYISADKDKLEKILNNLLNNAFKYTKPGDAIKLVFNCEGKHLLLEVSDTGRGIAADDLPHIFERFYQSKHKHSEYIGGSGIGLAFSKRLVEMHYGYISAQSSIGEGTCFFVKLPVVVEKPDAIEAEIEESVLAIEHAYVEKEKDWDNRELSSIQTSGNFAEAMVFIAEDNTEMCRFIHELLNRFFKVKSFRNGKELADALVDEWPDLIVSDVLMPEMNGFDLCKNVKNDIKTSHIPVVLLTACTSNDEQLMGLNVGADAYITKPFDMQHLLTCIESLLQNKLRISERYKIDIPLILEKTDSAANDVAFLEKLYALLEENLDNTELDMERLAKKMYLNRTHFYQKVKAITNQTPFELLRTYRLKRAAELLIQKQLSVSEVYVMTGFKSRSNFSKLFKEKYGTSPGKYASESLKS